MHFPALSPLPPSLNPEPHSAYRLVASLPGMTTMHSSCSPHPSLAPLCSHSLLALPFPLFFSIFFILSNDSFSRARSFLYISNPPLSLSRSLAFLFVSASHSPLAVTRREEEHQRQRGRSGGLPAAAATAPAPATLSSLCRCLAHRPQRGRRQAPVQARATVAPAPAALLPPPPASLHKSEISNLLLHMNPRLFVC
jgi:hypothetical protein